MALKSNAITFSVWHRRNRTSGYIFKCGGCVVHTTDWSNVNVDTRFFYPVTETYHSKTRLAKERSFFFSPELPWRAAAASFYQQQGLKQVYPCNFNLIRKDIVLRGNTTWFFSVYKRPNQCGVLPGERKRLQNILRQGRSTCPELKLARRQSHSRRFCSNRMETRSSPSAPTALLWKCSETGSPFVVRTARSAVLLADQPLRALSRIA